MNNYIYIIGRRGGVSAHIPNVRMNTNNRAKQIDARFLPSSSTAVQMYEQSGGRISEVTEFGHDPIADDDNKCAMQAFTEKYPSFDIILPNLVNGNSLVFKRALKFYIAITRRLALTN